MEETELSQAASELGKRGAAARSQKLSKVARADLASRAVSARWSRTTKAQRRTIMQQVRAGRKPPKS